MCSDLVAKNAMLQAMAGGWRVAQTKRHDVLKVKAFVSEECSIQAEPSREHESTHSPPAAPTLSNSTRYADT